MLTCLVDRKVNKKKKKSDDLSHVKLLSQVGCPEGSKSSASLSQKSRDDGTNRVPNKTAEIWSGTKLRSWSESDDKIMVAHTCGSLGEDATAERDSHHGLTQLEPVACCDIWVTRFRSSSSSAVFNLIFVIEQVRRWH